MQKELLLGVLEEALRALLMAARPGEPRCCWGGDQPWVLGRAGSQPWEGLASLGWGCEGGRAAGVCPL